MSAYMAKAKAKAKAAHPDWPLCHGEARDEVCGCVLDAIEGELQRGNGDEPTRVYSQPTTRVGRRD